MEEIFGRFPGLGKKILQQLDSKKLAGCRKFIEIHRKAAEESEPPDYLNYED